MEEFIRWRIYFNDVMALNNIIYIFYRTTFIFAHCVALFAIIFYWSNENLGFKMIYWYEIFNCSQLQNTTMWASFASCCNFYNNNLLSKALDLSDSNFFQFQKDVCVGWIWFILNRKCFHFNLNLFEFN